MTLSSAHISLVELIDSWCDEKDRREHFVVFVDNLDNISRELPPLVGSFRPDLVWQSIDSKFRFIGEAKTRDDISNRHTRNQLREYLRLLSDQGYGELIVAVPWGSENTTRALIAAIQSEHDFEYCKWHVISDAP